MRIKKSFIAILIGTMCVSLCATEDMTTTTTTTTSVAKSVAPTAVAPKIVEQSPSEVLVDQAKKMCNFNMYKSFWRDGNGFIDFWATGNDINVNLESAYTSMRLFYNNFQSCEIINNTVVDQVSRMMPRLFERYFKPSIALTDRFKIIREDVEDLMLDRFIERLDLCHSQVDLFVSKLSFDVTNLVKSRVSLIRQEEEEREYREKLRNIIVRFLELIASRTVWYPHEYRGTWQSFISIANHFHIAGMRGIINDQDNLEELWNSLTTRFVWYLDFQGSRLPVEFYEQIEDDLKNNVVFFLEVPMQDKGIKSHKQKIAEAVLKAKTKALAFEKQGIITDQAIKV